jgi:L-amino acid N-acyltransferase YncA
VKAETAMCEITVRAMKSEDWQRVADIYDQGIKTNIATFQTQVPDWQTWNSSHREDARLVAEKYGSILGFAVLSQVSWRFCYIGVAEVSIYVAADQRGKGIGKLLLESLVELSEKIGIWTLQSSIDCENISSIRLHSSCGFRIIGYREKLSYDRFGTWRDTVLMERRSKTVGV